MCELWRCVMMQKGRSWGKVEGVLFTGTARPLPRIRHGEHECLMTCLSGGPSHGCNPTR